MNYYIDWDRNVFIIPWKTLCSIAKGKAHNNAILREYLKYLRFVLDHTVSSAMYDTPDT